jgi:hypothetical protein
MTKVRIYRAEGFGSHIRSVEELSTEVEEVRVIAETAAGGGLEEAPNDGQQYVRQSEDWEVSASGGIDEAPNDGQRYVRQNEAWSVESGVGSVFGTEYQIIKSDNESSTASASYTTKVTLTTTSLPAGTYRIGATMAISNDTIDKPMNYRVAVDGQPNEFVGGYTPPIAREYEVRTGFDTVDFNAGVHTVAVQFQSGGAGGNALIRGTRIELYRIS